MTIEDVHSCVGCALCADLCPKQAITFGEDKDGYLRPSIDHAKCVDCGLCYAKCVAVNEVRRHELQEERPYASWTTDDELISHSASGGVFAQVAKSFRLAPMVMENVVEKVARKIVPKVKFVLEGMVHV